MTHLRTLLGATALVGQLVTGTSASAEEEPSAELRKAKEFFETAGLPDGKWVVTTADGIERLWQAAEPLLDAPPPVRPYAPGSWGPNAIHQLVAPRAWRLPFERIWRDPNRLGS